MTNDEREADTFIKISFYVGFFLLFAVGVLFLLIRCTSIFDTRYLGAAEEDAKTHANEHSKVYRDGVLHDLDDLCLSYAKAVTSDEKGAIASVMRHRVESAPKELVPACATDILRGAP
jgi:hypothetical protein